MPTFLSDPPQTVYLLLIAAAVVTGAVAAKNQSRRSLVPFAAAAAILLLVYLADRTVESPREEAVRKVQAMVKAANDRDPAAFTEHVAAAVTFRGEGAPITVPREQLRTSGFWNVLKVYEVRVAAWDFARDDVSEPEPGRVEVGFLAKGQVPDGKQFPLYFRGTFARQPDGRLALVAFATFDPVQRQNKPVSIPYFP